MGRYGLDAKEAKKLQEWALNASGAVKYLKAIPDLPNTKKIKPGIYVDYSIDKSELEDDGIDYCTPEIAAVYAANKNGKIAHLGGIRAYNWETYWLEIEDDGEVDTAENWRELIQEQYERLKEKNETNKKSKL